MGARKYKYLGTNQKGRKVSGEIEANDTIHAKRILFRRGIKPKSLKANSLFDQDLGMVAVDLGLAKSFGKEELTRFTKQLSILINAGVPIIDALDSLRNEEKNFAFKAVIKKIVDDVGKGLTLHESLAKHQGFDKLYCALVKAGEAAGILDTILEKLAEFMEKQEATKRKIKSALTYPTIVVIVGIGVVIGLMVFVVPQFVGMLKESNQEIPAVTQFVIDTSNFFRDYLFHILGTLFGGFFTWSYWKKTPQGKPVWDEFAMKAPLFGQIIIKGNLASFTRTLATMLAAGVPIIDALDICIQTLDNHKMAKDLRQVKEAVVKGKSITQPLGRIKYFPPLVNQMMKVGEATGNLDQMLTKVANVFDLETDQTVSSITKLIEPFILIVLGGIIGTVLIAMYLPIFMAAGGAGE